MQTIPIKSILQKQIESSSYHNESHQENRENDQNHSLI